MGNFEPHVLVKKGVSMKTFSKCLLTVPKELRMAFLMTRPKSSMKSMDVAKGSMAQQMM